jgi:hypothetical protein
LTQAAVRVLTPRAKAWLGRLAPLLPKDQSCQIVNSFTHHSYTSVDGIMEEDEQALFAMPGIKDLKAGAKIALRKKLAEFKVRKLGGNRRGMPVAVDGVFETYLTIHTDSMKHTGI